MTNAKHESLERFFRTAAYRLVAYRDGYGNVFKYKKKFEALSTAPRNVIRSYSLDKLRAILNHSYRTCTFYREIWDRENFSPVNIKGGFEELAKLPILKKAAIQENKDALVSTLYKKDELDVSHTGGSSGNPISFYRDRSCTSQRVGRQLAILEHCGYYIGTRCGLIWGIHDELPDRTSLLNFRKQFRRFANPKEAFCCSVMHAEQMKEFHRRLKLFSPRVLYGYPNAMTHFGEFIISEGLDHIKVDRILCTAERLTLDQRERLTEVFGCEVFNLYCTREHGCIGFECGQHKGFHIDVGSVHLEIVSNGRPVDPERSGRIVVTDLLNYGMPFIRYEIGDVGTLSADPCKCGCNLPILRKLEGRVSDLLIRPDGSTVAGLMLIDMFMDETKIENMQIVQEDMAHLDVFLESHRELDNQDRVKVIRECKKYMGEEVEISIHVVTSIKRNLKSGKFQEVICRVPASAKRS